MTLRKEIEPLRKITLNVYEADYARLSELHPTVGPQRAIRQLIRTYIERIDRRVALAKGETYELDIRIDGEGPFIPNAR
jgi:hypothetical protein